MSKSITLEEIKQVIETLAAKINAPEDLLPSYNEPAFDCHPYIEVDRFGVMFYKVYERGQERKYHLTAEIDDLLYIVFSDITFDMACKYELENRVETQDARRIIFKKQEDLLGELNNDWKAKRTKEHEEILKQHPFHN